MALNRSFRKTSEKRSAVHTIEPLESRVLLAAQLFVTDQNAGTIGEYTTAGVPVNASLISGLDANTYASIALSGPDVFVSNYFDGTIGEYTSSGGVVNANLVTGLQTGLIGPFGITVSGSELFVANGDGGSLGTNGTIGEYTLGDTPGTIASSNPTLVTGLADPGSVVVSGSDLFITDYARGVVGEYTTSGQTVNATLVSGLSLPEAVAVSGSDLFVTTNGDGKIGEYTTSGTIVNASLVSALGSVDGIAVAGSDLFVVNLATSAIGEYTTSGTQVNAALISGLTGPLSIAATADVLTTQLVFAQPPGNGTTNGTLKPITVDIQDSDGNLLTSDNSNVTISLANNPTDTTLGGTTTVAAINGVATFSDLSITTVGSGYTLTATDDSNTAVTSTSFNIFPPPSSIGGLDPNFGTQGLVSHFVGFNSTNGVAQDGTQSVIIGTVGSSPNESFGITRYNADGSLDTTFGAGTGVVISSFAGTDDIPSAVIVLAGGQILVAGTATTDSGSQFAIAEYNADGSVDTGFGGGTGQALVSFAGSSNVLLHAMAIGGSTIYLAGSSNGDFAIAAINGDGTPATPFNGTGTLLLDFAGGDDSANALAVQSNGELIVAGSTTFGGITSIALTRLLNSGATDAHFGIKGQTITNVLSTNDQATSVAIQSKGQIVVGGLSVTGSASDGTLSSDFLVARYTATGKIDPTFGRGPVITSFGQPAAVTSVLIQADGGIVASGKTTASLATLVPSELDVAIARYTTKGVLDTSFNNTGKAIISLTGVTPSVITNDLSILPLDAPDLNQALNELIASDQGAVTMNSGGELLIVGNVDNATVEGAVVTAGIDLLAELIGAPPTAVVGGAKGNTTVQVTESGTTLANGAVTITLSVSPNADGSGAVSIQNFPNQKISLKQSKGKIFKLKFLYPTSLADGNYFLIATVDTGQVRDLDAINNTAASSVAVDIAAPFVDLSGSNLTISSFKPGKPAPVVFSIINNGNIFAKGTISVEFLASPNQTLASGLSLITVPGLKLNLKNGLSKPIHERLIIPSTLPAGTYFLLAVIDPDNILSDANTNNNLLVSVGTFSS
jgi:uncharacterized delta-60 repeat protein